MRIGSASTTTLWVVTLAATAVVGAAPPAVSALDEVTLAAVREALADEYRSRDTYHAVIARFGPVRPFVRVVEAERRHVQALEGLLRSEDAAPPAAPSPSPVAGSVAAACAAAAAAERENVAMYDRLLKQVTVPDVRRVFTHLRAASLERHLPAFERCASRGPAAVRRP